MKDWPHAPVHRIGPAGAFIVTAGTYLKVPIFRSQERLKFLTESLLATLQKYGWEMQAWAVFPNHYHFVATAPASSANLPKMIRYLHAQTAMEVSRLDATPQRSVWFEYWDTHLTYEKSYFARLNYVHRNAVHHGLVRQATAYPWCSAGWFQIRADGAFSRRILALPVDRLRIRDDYAVDPADWQ